MCYHIWHIYKNVWLFLKINQKNLDGFVDGSFLVVALDRIYKEYILVKVLFLFNQ